MSLLPCLKKKRPLSLTLPPPQSLPQMSSIQEKMKMIVKMSIMEAVVEAAAAVAVVAVVAEVASGICRKEPMEERERKRRVDPSIEIWARKRLQGNSKATLKRQARPKNTARPITIMILQLLVDLELGIKSKRVSSGLSWLSTQLPTEGT